MVDEPTPSAGGGLDAQRVYPREPAAPGKVWMGNKGNTAWKQVDAALVQEGKKRGYRVVSPMFAAHAPEVGRVPPAGSQEWRRTVAQAPMPGTGGTGVSMGGVANAAADASELLGMLAGGAFGNVPGAGIGATLGRGAGMGLRDLAGTPEQGNPGVEMLKAMGRGLIAQKAGSALGTGARAAQRMVGNRAMEGATSAPTWVEEQAIARPRGKAQKPWEILNEMGLTPGKKAPGVYGTTVAGEVGRELHQVALRTIGDAERAAAQAGRPMVFNAKRDFSQVFDDFVNENYGSIPNYERAALAREMQARFELQHGWSPNRNLTARQVYEMGHKAMTNSAAVLDKAAESNVPVTSLPENVQVRAQLDAMVYKRANELLRPNVPGFEEAQTAVQNAMFAKSTLQKTEGPASARGFLTINGPKAGIHPIPSRAAEFAVGRSMSSPANLARTRGTATGLGSGALDLLLQRLMEQRGVALPPDSTGGQP